MIFSAPENFPKRMQWNLPGNCWNFGHPAGRFLCGRCSYDCRGALPLPASEKAENPREGVYLQKKTLTRTRQGFIKH